MLERKFINVENIDYEKLDNLLSSFSFVKKNNRKTTERLVNAACSFDTETTSTYIGNEKVAFTYFWQLGLTDSFYCYGRTWEQFVNLCEHISNTLQLNDGQRLVIYVHNLAFEFQFMRKYFDWDNVFSTKERNPIKALTSLGIEFRDSYILSGLPLFLVAENLTSHTIKKLVGDLDYSLVRTPETSLSEKELAYCLNDVIILVDYIEEQIEQYGNISKVPLTNTGRVRLAVREKAFSKQNYSITRKLMQNLTLTPDVYKQMKRAFAGGFTHANKNYVGKIVQGVQSMDFTSSYPTVLLASNRFPMSKPLEYKYQGKEKFLDDLKNPRKMFFFNATFSEIVTKIDYENYLSKSKCFDTDNLVENNGRVWSAHKLSVTICSIDWEIIQKCYDWENVEFSEITMFTTSYLPKYMLESVIEFYKKKTTLKGVAGKEREYLLFKGMLNSLYGMTVTDFAKPEITYDADWGKELLNLDECIEDYNGNKNRFLYYPWGVVVTALARQNLWSGILALGNDYIYSDTDSVKFINPNKHAAYFEQYNQEITNKLKTMCKLKGLDYADLEPATVKGVKKPLGVWDDDGFYDLFKTLGAKRYVVSENGELKITIAGLGKKAGREYLLNISNGDIVQAIKNFKIGLRVPAGQTGKNVHTYLDEPFSGVIVDYQGKECKIESLSSVHLEATSFEMSISETFAEFLASMVTTGTKELKEIVNL